MTPPESFETALGQLEGVVRTLEDTATTLDDSLAQYERGVGLLKYCYGQLQHAEKRIVLLSGTDDAGEPILAAFDHVATAVAADAPRKPRGRKKDDVAG